MHQRTVEPYTLLSVLATGRFGPARFTAAVLEFLTKHKAIEWVLHPTLETGVATLVVASRAWLATQADR